MINLSSFTSKTGFGVKKKDDSGVQN